MESSSKMDPLSWVLTRKGKLVKEIRFVGSRVMSHRWHERGWIQVEVEGAIYSVSREAANSDLSIGCVVFGAFVVYDEPGIDDATAQAPVDFFHRPPQSRD